MQEQKGFHKKLTDRESIAAAVKDVNERINGTGFSFMEDTAGKFKSIASDTVHEKNILIILASFDFSYYHNLEMVFYEVSYTDINPGDEWWDHWTKDQLELSKANDPGEFEFRFNIGTHKEEQFIVKAKGFSYCFENVGYRS